MKHDIQNLSNGVDTEIGERGTNVSGGQKARISLARAVYSDADIYLLDDPLSAVDPEVAEKLYRKCIEGYLKSKCVILATHQIQYLKSVKNILVLEEGKIRLRGSYNGLKDQGLDFDEILREYGETEDTEYNKDEESSKRDAEDQKGNQRGALRRKTALMRSFTLRLPPNLARRKAVYNINLPKQFFDAIPSENETSSIKTSSINTSSIKTSSIDSDSNKFDSYESSMESSRHNESESDPIYTEDKVNKVKMISKETKDEGNVPVTIWCSFFNYGLLDYISLWKSSLDFCASLWTFLECLRDSVPACCGPFE